MFVRSIASVAVLSALALSALASPVSAASLSAKVVDEKGQACTLRSVRDGGSPKAGYWTHNVYVCGGETRSVFDAGLSKISSSAQVGGQAVDTKVAVKEGCFLRAVRDNQGSPKAGYWAHNVEVCPAA